MEPLAEFDKDEGYTAAEVQGQRRFGRTLRLGMLLALVLSLGFAGGLTVGAAGGTRVLSAMPLIGGLDATPDSSISFADYWKVYNAMRTRFVDTQGTSTPPTRDETLWGAIQGMVASYDDPYTVFFPPEEAKIFQQNISGNFGGVGMEIGKSKDGILTVIAPLKGTPAERAGIEAGDLIVAIDGTSTEGLAVDEAVTLIRGPKGTEVELTLLRDGSPREISVVRDTIQVPTLESGYDRSTGVYTITLYEFTGTAAERFDAALEDFARSGSKRLLIDVRGNPGGYLDAAVAMASHFLPKGAPVVSEDYNGNRPMVVHRSAGTGGIPEGTRIAILIDGGSASASEILAGALQDTDRATVIGTRSFGKGSVQELIPVGGGSLKITVARWLTPAGRSISANGVTPDIEVERTEENTTNDRDPQKERAIEYLRAGR